jgi:hypothetical protein
MDRGSEMNNHRQLSLAEYERLCAEACLRFTPSGSREDDEETLAYSICRNVYSFLQENMMTFFPLVDVPNLQAYEEKLRQLVAARQSEPFNTLELPRRYIHKRDTG